MRKIQTQDVHHITLVGADRQTSIDFWEGVLGIPFEALIRRSRESLSDDRDPKDRYQAGRSTWLQTS